MHASLSFAAALVALAPAVQAVGTAHIVNQCAFPVYVFPTGGGSSEGPIEITPGGGTYQQTYQFFDSGGMSMKLSTTKECANITQFEYTLAGNTVYYDVSNVDCFDRATPCPFQAHGLHMSSGSGCPVVTCQPGDAKCHDAYNLFNDDWATKACSIDDDTTLHLCTTSGSDSSGSSSSSTPVAPNPIQSFASSVASSIVSKASSAFVGAPSSQAPKKAAASTPESVAAPAAPTSTSATPLAADAFGSKPTTTLVTSVKAKPSVAAPETTEAPAGNIVYTTEIAYTTQWATKWVEGRSVHEDFHHRAKPRSPHAHARRHQLHSEE